MLQDIHVLYGALALTLVMVWEFFALASSVGALKVVGRKPLASRPFLALSVAALLPGCCFLLSLELTRGLIGSDRLWAAAASMATVALAGRWAMGALRHWGSQEEG